MREMELRASGMQTTMAVVREMHGAAVLDRGIEALPQPLRDSVRANRLLPSTWVPITSYAAMLKGFALDDGAMKAIGVASVERDVNTIYRAVFRLLSAELLARQTPRLFGIYFRGGKITVLESGKDFCRVDYRECYGFDRLVWQDYLAGAEGVLKFCGARGLHIVVEEGGRDEPSMIASARWE